MTSGFTLCARRRVITTFGCFFFCVLTGITKLLLIYPIVNFYYTIQSTCYFSRFVYFSVVLNDFQNYLKILSLYLAGMCAANMPQNMGREYLSAIAKLYALLPPGVRCRGLLFPDFRSSSLMPLLRLIQA